MSLLDPYIPLLFYLAVWVVIYALAVLLKADKHGIIAKPYYLMLKTVVFNSWIERIGSRFRRGWLAFFDIGAAMGIGLLVFVIYSFINNAVGLFRHSSSAGPTLLIIPLPGLTIGWDIFPYILLAIAVLLIPHELAHGIASVLDKVPLKSSGVFMAIFLPGGFVEIDEENLAKRKARTKLRVFAAGSFTNVATWALVLLLLVALFQPSPTGVLVTGFTSGSPAQAQGMPQWSIITQVNNNTTPDVQHLGTYLASLAPGAIVTVHVSNPSQTLTVTTGKSDTNATRAILGVQTANYVPLRYQFLPVTSTYQLLTAFSWMQLILLGVALVNMLPLFPFDGDRYLDTLLGVLGLKNTKNVRTVASVISLGLLGSNIILSYILFGTIFPR
ncbi:PDZ domain-containing protein [Candidatus Bathyarchaeota archaeon]|nr:MAG: PDZ domain-containing protein [Candidatus Bathyarchaeota archaeon]TMI46334.1 MAG: PDZ domain-containing protein [Candidatus Bathyarchaeota archaeon]